MIFYKLLIIGIIGLSISAIAVFTCLWFDLENIFMHFLIYFGLLILIISEIITISLSIVKYA